MNNRSSWKAPLKIDRLTERERHVHVEEHVMTATHLHVEKVADAGDVAFPQRREIANAVRSIALRLTMTT
jgi:hypothetical protein